jgi:hypothetical protein
LIKQNSYRKENGDEQKRFTPINTNKEIDSTKETTRYQPRCKEKAYREREWGGRERKRPPL